MPTTINDSALMLPNETLHKNIIHQNKETLKHMVHISPNIIYVKIVHTVKETSIFVLLGLSINLNGLYDQISYISPHEIIYAVLYSSVPLPLDESLMLQGVRKSFKIYCVIMAKWVIEVSSRAAVSTDSLGQRTLHIFVSVHSADLNGCLVGIM